MTSKLTITREQATDKEIQMLIDSHENGTAMFLRVDAYYLMAKELQERRKAAMDSEPVAIIDQANLDYLLSGADADVWPPEREEMGDVLLYRHAQPAPVAQKEPISFDEWSRKCALQITLCYPDFREKAQYIWDSARETQQPAPVVPNGLRLALSNAGIAAPESDEMLAATCEKHIQALVTWVKDRKPFQSAPVVPSFEEWLSAANRKPLGWVKDAMREASDACRAAMIQAGTLTNEGETILHNYRTAMEGIGHIRRTLEETFGGLHGTHVEPDVLMDCKTICDAIYAAYSGNSPVIPDGYVMVPKEPTEAMINAWLSEVANWRGHVAGYKAMLAAAPQEVKGE